MDTDPRTLLVPGRRWWWAGAVLAALIGAACTTVPAGKPGKGAAAPESQAREPAAEAAPPEPPRPNIALSEDLLYKILVAEFAGQRGELDTAVANYLELARETRDPLVVERATRIAVYARDPEAAEEAAKLWVELDPDNPDPHQVLAVTALRKGDADAAMEHLEDILDKTRGDLDQKLLLVSNLLGREQNHELVTNLMEKLVAKRSDSPEALYAFAHVAARLGDLDRSRALLERALKLAPDNDNAALSYVSILQRQDHVEDALNWLQKELERRKDNDFNLRLAYARLLTDAKRYDDSRHQFEILAREAPKNNDIQYALGLLSLQANRLDDAEGYFRRLADSEERSDDADYYLGRIAEERNKYDEAATWYQGVQQGENYFDAQIRLGLILAKEGKLDAARAQLKQVHAQGTKERVTLVQAEAEMLTDQKKYDEAMDVYDTALERGFNADLLYARAMLAEKMNRLDILESDLREIISQDPDHAQALNALGYTLADRTTRYQEAYDLIKRALNLNPDDFYILDSMGWVLYRLGKLEESVEYLRKAMSLRADPEIAAHLGEVLWVRGDRDAAKKVWETALKATPDDTSLLDVIKRFNP